MELRGGRGLEGDQGGQARPMILSQIAFTRGTCGGLARILTPSAMNTASKGRVNWPAGSPQAVVRLHPVLDQIDLIDFSPRMRILAQTVQPVTVRSLDAIHLGTVPAIKPDLTSFVTYDKRLLDAAAASGLRADSPA
jgi:hypothetical protein